jgi:hypothetical protein
MAASEVDVDVDGSDNSDDGILAALERTGGIVPRPGWYEACLDRLRAQQEGQGGGRRRQCRGSADDADAVYAQALHHDLRHVVDRSNPSRAAARLRDAVRNCNGPIPTASSIPIRILVQVEEVVNVAQPRDARMMMTMSVQGAPAATGPAAPEGTAPGANASRCLKLQLVDGYFYDDDDNDVDRAMSDGGARMSREKPLVGMEVVPIPNLSERTLAGTKLLLCLGTEEPSESPLLDSSHGVLLLTPTNCLVVGGGVRDLEDRQVSDRRDTRERSGVGSDPTVRALISQNYLSSSGENGEDDGNEPLGTKPAVRYCRLLGLVLAD